MMQAASSAEAEIHHVALRVADAQGSKDWFVSMFDFRVEQELALGDRKIIWLCPPGQNSPVLELVGGGAQPSTQYKGVMSSGDQPGLLHICLLFSDVEEVVSELRRRDVNVYIDVMAGPPGTGIEKRAFVADPWGNAIELLQLAPESTA